MSQKVYLLGAGPGDPGLLTVKAKELLQRADVVIYDYLANADFLRLCPKEAELVYVGKKAGAHTLPQDKINELIVQKAGQGALVVRLKGGDPYIFGRGAEEAQELVRAGLDFEVVPGISSAVAATAYAGIPLTHRDYASSVSFVTGHEDSGKKESAHNWKSLATGTSTLVFFMGVKNLEYITQNLLENGMRPDMPAALVRWGTTCQHCSLVADLASIVEVARKNNMQAPALFIVGEVVRLRDELNWFEQKSLLGKGVIVTRAREQASVLTTLLQDQGACCLEFPTIAILPIADSLPIKKAIRELQKWDWLIFTSVNSVRIFWSHLVEMGLDARCLHGTKVAAIGPATADGLRERGINPDFIPPEYVAESIVQGLIELGVKGCRVLVPRALKAREVLPEKLREAGAEVEILPVYETMLSEVDGREILAALEAGEASYLTFTSSSTVENFFRLVKPERLAPFVEAGLVLACIGPVTAKTLKSFGFEAAIMPTDYTVPALAEALSLHALAEQKK